jgi:hypothetical protein
MQSGPWGIWSVVLASSLRVSAYFLELAAINFHVWDRMRTGATADEYWNRGMENLIRESFGNPLSRSTWAKSKGALPADYQAEIDRILALAAPSQ